MASTFLLLNLSLAIICKKDKIVGYPSAFSFFTEEMEGFPNEKKGAFFSACSRLFFSAVTEQNQASSLISSYDPYRDIRNA